MAERITAAVERTRRLWFIGMIIAAFYVSVTQPIWTLIFLFPIGVLTYLGSLTLTVLYLNASMPKEEKPATINFEKMRQLHEDLENGLIEPDSEEASRRLKEANAHYSPIEMSSDEVFGFYDGQPMYEWVMAADPYSKKMEKFFYFSPARYDKDGELILPTDKDMVYACVGGIVYAREG